MTEYNAYLHKNVNDEEIKEKHLRRLYELSLKSIGEIRQLEDPDKEWINKRMKAPESSWRSFS